MDTKQRELRKTLCTGTKVGPILGVGKFRTGYDVYAQCKGLVDDRPASDAMIRGIALERGILDLYEERKGVKLGRGLGTIIHPTENWMGASPDGYYIDEDGAIVIVDAKTSRVRDAWGHPGSDDVPVDYALQLQWYALILAAHFDRPVVGLDVITYFPMQDEIIIYSIAPDEVIQQDIVERCRKWWWRYIVSNVAPPLDHSNSAAEVVNKTSHTRGELIQIDESDAVFIKDLKEVKAKIKELETEKKGLETQIKSIIGDATGIVGGGARATWKEQRGRSSWDTKQLEVDHPELVEKYKKHGKTYRVLRIK